MPTRCNRVFLLQILLVAQHVSGTSMPIIRSSRVLCGGCCLWYFALLFSSCWSGVELRVMCPVCRMQTGHMVMGIVVPETCWASNKICTKNLCCIYMVFYFHIPSKQCWQHEKGSSPIGYYRDLLFNQSEGHPSTYRPLPTVYNPPDNTQIHCFWRWKLKHLLKYRKITIFVRGLPLKADPMRGKPPTKA